MLPSKLLVIWSEPGTGTDQMSEVLLLGSHKPLPADISAGNWGGKQRGCGLPWKEDVRGSQAYIIYSLKLWRISGRQSRQRVEGDLPFRTCQRALDDSVSEKKQWGPQGVGDSLGTRSSGRNIWLCLSEFAFLGLGCGSTIEACLVYTRP